MRRKRSKVPGTPGVVLQNGRGVLSLSDVIVTWVVTDVAASTQLWEWKPDVSGGWGRGGWGRRLRGAFGRGAGSGHRVARGGVHYRKARRVTHWRPCPLQPCAPRPAGAMRGHGYEGALRTALLVPYTSEGCARAGPHAVLLEPLGTLPRPRVAPGDGPRHRPPQRRAAHPHGRVRGPRDPQRGGEPWRAGSARGAVWWPPRRGAAFRGCDGRRHGLEQSTQVQRGQPAALVLVLVLGVTQAAGCSPCALVTWPCRCPRRTRLRCPSTTRWMPSCSASRWVAMQLRGITSV